MLVISETYSSVIPKVGQLATTNGAKAFITFARDHGDDSPQILGMNTDGVTGWDEQFNPCIISYHIGKLDAI